MGNRYTEAVPQEHLSKTEIIENLVRHRQIEKWIENIKKTSIKRNSLNDLAQDVYIILYEMDDTKIETLYQNGELPFFVNRILMNQINSTTSTYYYKYIKPSQLHVADLSPEQIKQYEENNKVYLH